MGRLRQGLRAGGMPVIMNKYDTVTNMVTRSIELAHVAEYGRICWRWSRANTPVDQLKQI